jgi:hypothetical protein
LLYDHRHQRLLGAAGHIILTPANQLMVMGLKIWSLSNLGFETATFRSLISQVRNLQLCLPVDACVLSALQVTGPRGMKMVRMMPLVGLGWEINHPSLAETPTNRNHPETPTNRNQPPTDAHQQPSRGNYRTQFIFLRQRKGYTFPV